MLILFYIFFVFSISTLNAFNEIFFTNTPACIASQVTCCFVVRSEKFELYINEENVTNQISPSYSDNFYNYHLYNITFKEPAANASFCVKGIGRNVFYMPYLQLSCQSTRVHSPWTFNSSPSANWRQSGIIDHAWFFNNNTKGRLGMKYEHYFPYRKEPDYNRLGASCFPNTSSVPALTHRHMYGTKFNTYWGLRHRVIHNETCDIEVTERPSMSPTQCSPGIVTCCIAVVQSLVELWVNDQDLTEIVQFAGSNNSSSSVYVVTFYEPSATAVFAMKGFEGSEVFSAASKIQCNSTRHDSPWNFASQVNTGWLSVSSTRVPNYQTTEMRPGWNLLNYQNASSNAIAYAGLESAIYFNTSVCQQPLYSLGHPQGLNSPRSWYWGLRRVVNQTVRCGTDRPTVIPTKRPTVSPVVPSMLPTSSPFSSAPTFSPSIVPTSSTPTQSPIISFPPTPSPSISPIIQPTSSPTLCAYHTVTCCFTMRERLVQLFVNETDITANVSSPENYGIESIPKYVSFQEPINPAMFAVKGFENNEILIGSMNLICKSTNVASRWNFVSNMSYPWKSVLSSSLSNDVFPPNWYSNYNYTDLVTSAATAITPVVELNTTLCGPVNSTNTIQAYQSAPARRYWTLKLFVNQTSCRP